MHRIKSNILIIFFTFQDSNIIISGICYISTSYILDLRLYTDKKMKFWFKLAVQN
jgi:hypothetical protein